MKNHRIIQKLVLLLYFAAVAYLCFGKFNSLPNIGYTIFGFPTDKVVHFAMFFPLPILLYWAFNWKTGKVWKSLLLVAFLIGIGLLTSMSTELIQGLTTYRSKDIMDFAADSISVCISAVIVLIIELFKDFKRSSKHD